ncbi:MAG: FTR1 family iron permease, partial [Helicobacter sp.]|nr:FTR1 family iron permease [Helicobacter sp.]
MERIEALIGGLVFELDLVLPLLDSSMKLVAEESDTNYDKAAAEAASIAAERQRAKEAEEMFARLLGETNESGAAESALTPATATPAPQSAQNSDNAAMQEFETAARLNPKLYHLYEQISGKFDIAALRLQKQQPLDAASMLEKEVLFDDYRNTKLEIVMNQHTAANAGQQWQAKVREIVRRLKNEEMSERELRSELAALSDRLFELLLLVPSEAAEIVQVKGFAQESASTDYANVANDIRIALNAIVDKYGQTPAQALIDELQSVYLDIFEASQMENKIGAIDSNLKLSIESRFTQGVALIKANAPKDALADNFDALNALVASSLEHIQDLSPAALLLAALVIIVREGLEAMLIVLAITAYLLQSGNTKHIGIVYSALGVGIFLSFVTAFAVYYLFAQFAGQFREILEGITMIIALFLLLYVGFWLLSKSYKWTDYIQAQAKEAIHKGSARVLWWTVFLAVYREGAETVLFYQSLFFSANDSAGFWAIIGGLCVGCAILLVLFFVLKAGAVRFPMRLFFQCTSYLIFS